MLEKVYEMDGDFQRSVLTDIATDIRHAPIGRTFIDNQFLYVPDEYYLPQFVGDYIKDPSLGLYDHNGYLRNPNTVWIPVRNFKDEVVGFAFYNSEGTPKYSMQRTIQNTQRYMNIRPSQYIQGLSDGYLCISDGFMDKFHQEYYGLPSTSIFGSYLSKYHIQYLKPFKHLILFMDNDKAGVELRKRLSTAFPSNLTTVVHDKGKDSDDFLKVAPEPLVKYIKERRAVWQSRYKL